MPTLLSGSLAYDFIMDFPDSFKNHILPDQIHILNVCFVVDKLKKHFGGTAGNIAYTMKLLGGEPLVIGALGHDGLHYKQHFKKFGISTKYISASKQFLSSSAYVTTDKDDNQITAYFNGAAEECHSASIDKVKEKIDLAIISPNKKEAMIRHIRECREKRIPVVFDPGQQITVFTPQEIMQCVGMCKFLIANDYEIKLIENKTGWNTIELQKQVETIIITLGEKGSTILTAKEKIDVASAKPKSFDDPTGAGDAYRAGFFTAYTLGYDLKTCGQMGAVAACYAIEHYGTQNHIFTPVEFQNRYKETFGGEISLVR